jgi:hypothetical protein
MKNYFNHYIDFLITTYSNEYNFLLSACMGLPLMLKTIGLIIQIFINFN